MGLDSLLDPAAPARGDIMAVAGDGDAQRRITHERPQGESESPTLALAFLRWHRDDEPSIVAAHQMDELFIYQL